MVSVALEQIAEMFRVCVDDDTRGTAALAEKVQRDVLTGIEQYGQTISNAETIYAFEVDGFGNQLLLDDANVPRYCESHGILPFML